MCRGPQIRLGDACYDVNRGWRRAGAAVSIRSSNAPPAIGGTGHWQAVGAMADVLHQCGQPFYNDPTGACSPSTSCATDLGLVSDGSSPTGGPKSS